MLIHVPLVGGGGAPYTQNSASVLPRLSDCEDIIPVSYVATLMSYVATLMSYIASLMSYIATLMSYVAVVQKKLPIFVQL